jgi:F-type H+-transporting ATPase subunit alpha
MKYFGKDFDQYLKGTGEVGYVNQIVHSIVYVKGLPSVRPFEIVIFETGDVGQVLSLTDELIEVLSFNSVAKVGQKVASTGKVLEVPVGEAYLGQTINPLGYGQAKNLKAKEARPVDPDPRGILERKIIDQPLETGVSVVDLTVPLGKGQRQLVLGDRDTGKTHFLMQLILTQARKGTICIYAGIGKKRGSLARMKNFLKSQGIEKNTLVVASTSRDPAGIIFLTPYTAMTHAEYFRDQKKDVLVVLDDMTVHAKFYREITLLLQRFPGRSAYPGDIFYTHARLMERSGNFAEASISCLPVADTVLGDMSGYIQTNLMAMTDGHIFFDIELFNQGRRPAINTFLSVTRVGLQAQTPLIRDLSRQLASFSVEQDRLREFLHFGAELSEEIKRKLSLGSALYELFNQPPGSVVPINVSIYLVGALWAGFWRQMKLAETRAEFDKAKKAYETNAAFRKKLDALITGQKDFGSLVTSLKKSGPLN